MKMTSKPGPGKQRLENIRTGLVDVKGEVGWFPSSHYPDGTPVAYVAAINEFGPHARPFMRPTMTDQRNHWAATIDTQVRKLATGSNMLAAMTVLASVVEGDIAKKITSITSPPLKQSTIDRRFHSKKGNVSVKPLVDTRLMFDTLTSVVERT